MTHRRAAVRLAPGARPCSPPAFEGRGRSARADRPRAPADLRISADPNNMPFTKARREGFENKIAELLPRPISMPTSNTRGGPNAEDSSAPLSPRARPTLSSGVPIGFERALVYGPVLSVVLRFRHPEGEHPGDPLVRRPGASRLKVGVQSIGDDGTNTPPAHAIAARGMVDNVVGFTVYGDYAEESPPSPDHQGRGQGRSGRRGRLGPARRLITPDGWASTSRSSPVKPEVDRSGLPLAFEIGMGVRKKDQDLNVKSTRFSNTGVRRSARSSTILGSPGFRPSPDRLGRSMRVELSQCRDATRASCTP